MAACASGNAISTLNLLKNFFSNDKLSTNLFCCLVSFDERTTKEIGKYPQRNEIITKCVHATFPPSFACQQTDVDDFSKYIKLHLGKLDQSKAEKFIKCANDKGLFTYASINVCELEFDTSILNELAFIDAVSEDDEISRDLACCVLEEDVQRNPKYLAQAERDQVYQDCLDAIFPPLFKCQQSDVDSFIKFLKPKCDALDDSKVNSLLGCFSNTGLFTYNTIVYCVTGTGVAWESSLQSFQDLCQGKQLSLDVLCCILETDVEKHPKYLDPAKRDEVYEKCI